MFYTDKNKVFALPSCADAFFEKYLEIFESVKVLGIPAKGYLNKESFIEMLCPKIEVEIIPENNHPKDFRYDGFIRKVLQKEISKVDAVLIKPASRKGMMAINLCKEMNKPYMIEITGDIHNALKQHPNVLKRMYAPILYNQILKSIKDCEFGLYVSENYLQSQFPIKGKMCGCPDVVLPYHNDEVLNKRFTKIETRKSDEIINLCLIGFYQGKMKGVDCAIRALAHLPEKYVLNILGNGTEENRQKWYEYSERFGIKKSRLLFHQSLAGSDKVCEWLDSMDCLVFPTRSEGFGRVVAEAQSRGLPCLATNICTMPELIEKDYLFDLNNDDELANKLLKLYSDKVEEKRVSRRNFEHSKRYEFNILRRRRNEFLEEFKKYSESYCKGIKD